MTESAPSGIIAYPPSRISFHSVTGVTSPVMLAGDGAPALARFAGMVKVSSAAAAAAMAASLASLASFAPRSLIAVTALSFIKGAAAWARRTGEFDSGGAPVCAWSVAAPNITARKSAWNFMNDKGAY